MYLVLLNCHIYLISSSLKGGHIKHEVDDKCLEGHDSEVNIARCDENNAFQKWEFLSYPFDEQRKEEKL